MIMGEVRGSIPRLGNLFLPVFLLRGLPTGCGDRGISCRMSKRKFGKVAVAARQLASSSSSLDDEIGKYSGQHAVTAFSEVVRFLYHGPHFGSVVPLCTMIALYIIDPTDTEWKLKPSYVGNGPRSAFSPADQLVVAPRLLPLKERQTRLAKVDYNTVLAYRTYKHSRHICEYTFLRSKRQIPWKGARAYQHGHQWESTDTSVLPHNQNPYECIQLTVDQIPLTAGFIVSRKRS